MTTTYYTDRSGNLLPIRKPLTLRIDQKLHWALREEAHARKLSLNELIVDVLANHISKGK